MTVYVALLRAIGPVSHAKMRPAALRDKAEEAGFTDPVNYLATGNLIFGSTKSAAVVKKEITALVEGFGLTTSEVFIATKAQIETIVEADPFPKASKERPQRVGVCFFHETLDWPAGLNPARGAGEGQGCRQCTRSRLWSGRGAEQAQYREAQRSEDDSAELEHGSWRMGADEGIGRRVGRS